MEGWGVRKQAASVAETLNSLGAGELKSATGTSHHSRQCNIHGRCWTNMMRVGLYRPVHVKTLRSQELRMLLTHRKLLQSKAIAIGIR